MLVKTLRSARSGSGLPHSTYTDSNGPLSKVFFMPEQHMTATAQQNWIIATLTVPAENSEDAAEWIRDALQVEPVELSRPHTDVCWLELYFTDPVQALLAQRALQHQFPGHLCSLRHCDARDWQAFWKNHFHTRNIGERLQIVPVWENSPDNGRATILLEPGLSFGTGDHFTTRFCLEQIDRLFAQDTPQSMLDAGTGSGILAIAAEKLGCTRIDAFDFDPLCLQYTRENLQRNHTARIHLFEHDITLGIPGGPYDLVCANIFSRLLIQSADALVRATREHLILTGILQTESDDVSQAFLERGGRETVWDGDGEWCGMVYDFSAHPAARKAGEA